MSHEHRANPACEPPADASLLAGFLALARSAPGSPAVFAPDGAVRSTRGELADGAAPVARRLAATDPADRLIGVAVAEPAAFVEVLLGTWWAGRVPVLLDPELTDAERTQVAQQLGMAHFLTGPTAELTPTGAARRPVPVPANAALIKLTSGSSGRPKGILVTHCQARAEAAILCEAFALRATTRSLAVIPLAHSYGFGNLVLPLLTQGTPVVAGDPFDPRLTLRQAEAADIEVLPLVPLQVDLLGQLPDPPRTPPSLRLVIAAGAPLGEPAAECFRRAYGLAVTRFYGTSETGPVACGPALPAHRTKGPGTTTAQAPPWGAPGTGRAMPEVQIEVLVEAGATTGRVRVRSPAVAAGYYPQADPALAEGAFLTDDLGCLVGGEIHLAGRVSRRINVAGRKVQPEEVERVLATQPEVREALVLGLPRSLGTEEVVAMVAGPAGLRAENLRRACRAVLSAHKVPRRILIVPSLPRTSPRGKVDLARAREMLAADVPRPGARGSGARPVPGPEDRGRRG